jgi:S-adenosylmethionine synthetase
MYSSSLSTNEEMDMKVYVRERVKIGKGVQEPRFRVVAVTSEKGGDAGHFKIEATHFRKVELERIAKDVGAEIVYMEPMPEEERGRMKGE